MRYIFYILGCIALIGCVNGNKIEVQNYSNSDITLNFKAKEYPVPSGTTKIIDDKIQNGTYSYSFVYYAPSGYNKYSVDTSKSSDLEFSNRDTKILMQFEDNVMNNEYTLFIVTSSSQPVNSGSPTGTE